MSVGDYIIQTTAVDSEGVKGSVSCEWFSADGSEVLYGSNVMLDIEQYNKLTDGYYNPPTPGYVPFLVVGLLMALAVITHLCSARAQIAAETNKPVRRRK